MKKVRPFLFLSVLFVSAALRAGASTIAEDFSSDPAGDGWQVFGDTNLFQWDSTNQNLSVTWDSSQPNSYFYHSLGTILTTNDEFSFSFDLNVSDADTGGFELAVGLFNLSNATNPGFLRGTGYSTPNLVEFDYFPPDSYGDPPSVDATLVDQIGAFPDWVFFYDNVLLDPGTVYHVTLSHPANSAIINADITVDGEEYSTFPSMYPYTTTNFTDFRIDTFSVSSYSDSDGFGSVLAHGTVDNVAITLPPTPIQSLAGGFTNTAWQAEFLSADHWVYTLQRTADFQSWSDVSAPTPGNGTNLFLQDPAPPAGQSFYRIRANRP